MNSEFNSQHWLDHNQKPAGGCSYGTGFAVSWQNGPLGRGLDRQEPNGAFVETMISVVLDRLEFYQGSGFDCSENAEAIAGLQVALDALQSRTNRREKNGVEGTHKGK